MDRHRDGARILLGAHIDDFVIACANQQVLDGFRARLLDVFEGTYEGALQHYLGCEVMHDMDKGTTYLYRKKADNFIHESDVTSLQDLSTSRPSSRHVPKRLLSILLLCST